MTVHPIAADDESTWPDGVRSKLDASLADLRAYHDERRRIDKLGERDYAVRFNPPPNPWRNSHDETISLVDRAVRDLEILGYHCTRLTLDEVEKVKREGLRPTGAELVAERIAARVAAGDIVESLGRVLIAQSCAEHTGRPREFGSRKGMVWLCFTLGCLRAESGVYRLLTCWGGEMTYWAHDEDGPVVEALRSLGTACIVEAAVPAKAIHTFCDVGERLVRSYLHRRGIQTEHDADWEGWVERAENVRRVVTRSDPDFERLTECDRWDEAPT